MTVPTTETPRRRRVLDEILATGATTSVLAVVLAMLVGAVLIVATDDGVAEASAYFFSRPLDTLAAAWEAVAGAYRALFQGAVFNARADSIAMQLRPLTETLTFATPLIAAGLGIAVAFRAGMFNIGGRGQMLIAAACAGWVGFTFSWPPVLHLLAAVAAGLVGGALWGGAVGLLKARTGAHEVIVTIMLNYIAFYLVSYLLRTPALQAPGSSNPKSPPVADTAVLFGLLGPRFNLHVGFLLAIAATVATWWLIERSSLGFKLKAVGLNPSAARVAGIDVGRIYIVVMVVSGALVGLAGANQALSTAKSGFSSGVDAGIGFDAITVALLGRSRPWGVLAAGILFGAFKAGGFAMQASRGIPVDIVLVIQSLIVLFIAAPPLVRVLFRLPDPAALPRGPRPGPSDVKVSAS